MQFKYENEDIKKVDILQEDSLKIYGKYDLEKSMLWMTEEFGEFFKSIRKNDPLEEIEGEMGDLLAWIFVLGNILGINVSDAIEGTFNKEINRQMRVYSKLKYCENFEHIKPKLTEAYIEKFTKF